MARYFGTVGFGESTEIVPGRWDDVVTEREYSGDIVRAVSRLEGADKLHADIEPNNSISILADQYAIENFPKIKYVTWMGVRWTTTSVEFNAPRLVLNIGEVYNGPTP